MATRFCKKCRNMVGKNDLYCPYCNAIISDSSTTAEGTKKRSKAAPVIIILVVIALTVGILLGGLWGLTHFDILDLGELLPFMEDTENNGADNGGAQTPPSSDQGIDTPDASDTTSSEPEPEPEPYTVVHKAGLAGCELFPIRALGYTDHSITSLELTALRSADKSTYTLVDYEGNKVSNYSSSYAPFLDSLGNSLGNMSYGFLDRTTLELYPQESGQGIPGFSYCYIPATKEVVIASLGCCEKVYGDVDCAVVNLLTEADSSGFGYFYNGKNYDFTSKYGIVVDSQLVVPCEYDSGLNYQEGICALKKDGKWGYFNSRGEQILGFEYEPAKDETSGCPHNGPYCSCKPYPATYGYIAVCKDGLWAYADTDGNMVTDFEFESALPVHRGKAWVKQGGEWMVIAISGYTDTLTEADAKALLIEYINDNYPGISTDIHGLYKEKSFSFYLTRGYSFETADGVKFVVLYNGEIYRFN